jgi:phosphatidylglycerophosphate synthase
VRNPANLVTAARALVAALLLGLWAEAAMGGLALGLTLRWSLVAVAAASLAADGLDGWLARRLGTASAWGARFDMEVDAAMVLALALLVLAAGQAGRFVLASGAMRYLFVAAGLCLPRLRAPLPPSRRRQAVCVAQSLLLVVALAPALPAALGNFLAAVGLALLAGSFAIDLAGCYRARAVPL